MPSIKGSRKRKSTQFAKGNTLYKRARQSTDDSPADDAGPDEQQIDMTNTTACTRLDTCLAEDLKHVSVAQQTLPFRLRPRSEKKEEMVNTTRLDENIIVHIEKLEAALECIHKQHCADGKITVEIPKRLGLCVYVTAKCDACHFKSPLLPMSTEMGKRSRGPSGGQLNEQLMMPLLKTKITISDASTMLSCLNIKPPAQSTMQRKFEKMGRTAVQINTRQMARNQQYVQHVKRLSNQPPSADVQFDTAYSSRPQGGCEKATQSFGAIIDHTTTRKLPLALNVANKLCLKKGCLHDEQSRNDGSCSRTYEPTLSISSTERTLLQEGLQQVTTANILEINSITTDACAQNRKAILDFFNEHGIDLPALFKCLEHRGRTLTKKVKEVKLKLKNLPRKCTKPQYTNRLAYAIRERIVGEMRLHKEQCADLDEFLTKCQAAVMQILTCFSGNHERCRVVSAVCIAHLGRHSTRHLTRHLPNNAYINLELTEVNAIQQKILQVFNHQGLQETAMMFTTNYCESLNSSVFRVAPKTTRFARNFESLCHSATHSYTVGTGESTLTLAEASQIEYKTNSPFYRRMKELDGKRSYDTERQATQKFKRDRYYGRKKKALAPLLADSLYRTESQVSSEHSYGQQN